MFQALALIVDRSDHKNFFLISLSILIKRSLEKLWIPYIGRSHMLQKFCAFLSPLQMRNLHHGKTVGIRLFWSKKFSAGY